MCSLLSFRPKSESDKTDIHQEKETEKENEEKEAMSEEKTGEEDKQTAEENMEEEKSEDLPKEEEETKVDQEEKVKEMKKETESEVKEGCDEIENKEINISEKGDEGNKEETEEKPDIMEEEVKKEIKEEAEDDRGDKGLTKEEKDSNIETENTKQTELKQENPLKQNEDVLVQNGDVKTDEGSVNSEDSEKENMNIDVPMDLSTKSSTPSQDVIMLSDDEGEAHKRNGEKEYNLDDLKLKRKMIKRLQAELRNEEAKLVLLKKLRFSQMSHQVSESVAKKTPQPSHHTQPPPLVHGNQQQAHQAKPAHTQPPPPQRSSVSMPNSKTQGPPPLVMAPRMDQRHILEKQMKIMQQQQQQQQRVGSGATQQQNALAGFRGTQAQADALRQLQQAQRVVEETPAQRQAAAKLALRKQLENTLLQIPPPKPPPPEMNFIPSLASPDFIYLLGLEEAVNFIIDTNLISKGKKSPDEKMVCNPFTCVQCGTDFTPVWKREKPGSKNVICEQCVTSNQKKALKQEHTNRLKSAFVKALQQEQEIERMQSQEIKAASASSALKEKSEQRDRETSARNAAAQAYKESMAETLRQQQLVQAHQAAALRMGQPLGLQFNPRAPFPAYQLPFAARASDLQRQYLLDLIPKGGLPWNA